MGQFISYAQNFEDVMLWRALKDIEHGFYIDLGAGWPDMHSVTKAMYERGWHGINVEPNPEFHAQLMRKRPHDINLQLAVSNRGGKSKFQILNNTGLSTLDVSIAKQHEDSGWKVSEVTVSLTTLSALWKRHVPSGQEVHFLKIDVEGAEKDIIEATDWTSLRPWLIVIEATLPMSQVETHENWQGYLTGSDYKLVYADGLNHYYLASEHADRKASFRYPPNVFDDFIRADLAQSIRQNEALEAQHAADLQVISGLQSDSVNLEDEVSKARASLQEAKACAEKESERAERMESRLEEAESRYVKESERAERMESRLEKAEARLAQNQSRDEAATARAKLLEAQLAETHAHYAAERDQLHAEKNDIQARLNESLGNAHHWWVTATEHGQAVKALKSSWSWRLTWPLRRAFDIIRWLLLLPIHLAGAVLGPILRAAMAFVRNRPRLHQFASSTLQKLSFGYWPLFRKGQKAGLPVTALPAQPAQTPSQSAPEPKQPATDQLGTGGEAPPQSAAAECPPASNPNLCRLTPRARQIYADLVAAIQRQQGGE